MGNDMPGRITAVRFLVVGLMAAHLSSLEAVAANDDGARTTSITARYRSVADRIARAALAGNDGYNKLEELCLRVGHRLSGSPQLEKAIDWAIATMKADGQENVHRENVMVPHWVRGQESATLVEPRTAVFHILGLGGSVGTSANGVTAPVVVVSDEDELNALGEGARGKIVLFNKVMPEYDAETGSGYGRTVRYRTNGARLAAAKGAVACLVRSVTAMSLRTPHTGAMRYGDATVKIPTAAIATEDAEMLARFQKRGIATVVNLKMEAKTLPDALSANVVGELRGSTLPDEVVVIGGHLDSWDVGQGAHDDGGGCIMAMEAINVLRKLNLRPRRTIRVVLFTNEENGLAGGRAYAKDHENELGNHVAAIEADSGVFRPMGYGVSCSDKDRETLAVKQVGEIMALLSSSLGGLSASAGGGGADIGPMRSADVVLMGHRVEGSRYFNYHHTHADTIDKVDPELLSQNIAAMATTAYIIADLPEPLGGVKRPGVITPRDWTRTP